MFSADLVKYKVSGALIAGLFSAVSAAADVAIEPTTPELSVRVVAEVQIRVGEQAPQSLKMMPADKVVPGDLVYYTLEVRNTGTRSLQSPNIVQAVPAYTAYVANSASGPGCEITFSADGGHRFAPAAALIVTLPDGAQRLAVAREYTHIRYRMTSLVKSNSVVFLRFRARVK